jgi:hypothetical protein
MTRIIDFQPYFRPGKPLPEPRPADYGAKIYQFPLKAVCAASAPDNPLEAVLYRPSFILLAYRVIEGFYSTSYKAFWMPETGPRWVYTDMSSSPGGMWPLDRITRRDALEALTDQETRRWIGGAVILPAAGLMEIETDDREFYAKKPEAGIMAK